MFGKTIEAEEVPWSSRLPDRSIANAQPAEERARGEQAPGRRYATPDDIVQPENAPQLAETESDRIRRKRFLGSMLDEDNAIDEGTMRGGPLAG